MNIEDLLAALLLAVVLVSYVGLVKLSVAVSHGHVDHLFEPQWKREARELARYIPEADEWGR